jgi:CxxC motif-containing protein (DUF1111 family)
MSRILVAIAALGVLACTDQNDLAEPETTESPAVADAASDTELEFDTRGIREAHTALSGGATTVFNVTADAFSQPAPTLAGLSLARHDEGDEDFEVEFVPAPAAENSGLGPVFDNVSCESCHVGDGRGRPPAPGEQTESFLYRASIDGRGPHGGPVPVPDFGGQLQLRAVPGFTPEVSAVISYATTRGTFADGTPFELRAPQYDLQGLYAPLPPGVLISPRTAPVVFGLGLLEAVPESQIYALSDPRDRDRDGVSGRVNVVYNEVRRQNAVGRFGWKANAPTLLQQTAGAYNGDMGVTSSIFPAESCEGRPGCERHAIEVEDETVGGVAFYTQTLGVPARRNVDDPTASRGEQLFYAAGCAGCHMPTLRTGFLKGVPEVANQVIHPYTDLLVHDMGPGLADNRPDFQASGQEWRTPPLWGIGLVQTVNGHTNFLHDGRARSLMEAVLWHGGEARRARERVRGFSAGERAALIAFLQSL